MERGGGGEQPCVWALPIFQEYSGPSEERICYAY